MAGNVAEWTNSAYDPLSYDITWDMNPNYTYNAKDSDPPTMKRKVIRGGSWKDIEYFCRLLPELMNTRILPNVTWLQNNTTLPGKK